jgi:hypothetical protein
MSNDLIFCFAGLLNFDFYALLCGNDAQKQKSVHSSLACCVHVPLHIAAKQMFFIL